MNWSIKNTSNTPLSCKIKHKIIFKPANSCCLWGFKPKNELTKCYECEHCSMNFLRSE